MPIIYRLGEPSDEQSLFDLALALTTLRCEAAGFGTPDPISLRQHVHDVLQLGSNVNVLCAIDVATGDVAGALALYARKPFFLKESITFDDGFYVDPKYRNKSLKGANIAKSLLEWAIRTARSNGRTYLPGNSSGDPRADTLMKGLGGEYLGGVWFFK